MWRLLDHPVCARSGNRLCAQPPLLGGGDYRTLLVFRTSSGSLLTWLSFRIELRRPATALSGAGRVTGFLVKIAEEFVEVRDIAIQRNGVTDGLDRT